MTKSVEIPVIPLFQDGEPRCAGKPSEVCPFLCIEPFSVDTYCSAFTFDNGEFETIPRDGEHALEPHLSCPVHYEAARDEMRRNINAH